MLLEEKFLEFHRYASSHNLPLEAISVGDENKVLCDISILGYFIISGEKTKAATPSSMNVLQIPPC